MAVDWLQKCYESDFCFDVETGETIRGHYYWANPGANVLATPHIFGSAVWLDPEERGGLTYLGDQFENVSRDDGRRPEVRPLTQRLELRGRLECGPAPGPALAMTSDVYGGLPRHCYRTNLLECLPYQANLDVTDREVWCWAAKIIDKLYNGDPTVTDLLQERVLDVEHVVVNFDDDSLNPQFIMWRAKCGRGIILGGTTNGQQVATQAFYGVAGPMPVGEFYTSLFWFEVSQIIRETMRVNIGPHRNSTFLAGHSFGGAIAALIAASDSTPANKDEYPLLTFGAPRFGNGQIYGRISDHHRVLLQTEGDPVPSLPPTYPDLLDLLPILGATRYFFWQRWSPPPDQTVIRPDGTTYISSAWNGADVTAAALATLIRDRDLFPTFAAHQIGSYKSRICPAAPPPPGPPFELFDVWFDAFPDPILETFSGHYYDHPDGGWYGLGGPFIETLRITYSDPTLTSDTVIRFDFAYYPDGSHVHVIYEYTYGEWLIGIVLDGPAVMLDDVGDPVTIQSPLKLVLQPFSPG